ncbi:MAG: class I SAM-dependent methyltransferase, partial [Hyphomicrobiales bacterium]|nr:class I SAM-dependent methyltransferase [Hyphomicrobiales bacterium]
RCFEIAGKNPGPNATLVLNNWRLPVKILAGGSIGAGESYMSGDWDSPDITALFQLITLNGNLGNDLSSPNWFMGMLARITHWYNENSLHGSRKNIARHYDLGNEFYSKWLDDSMTYSSGIFDNHALSLSASQKNKYRTLAKTMGIKPDDRVLEIGCGWGGFAQFAAKEIGCNVTGLTISQEQFDFARERVHKAGLSEKVDIKLQDYRHERGKYDRIASIEMFEAVGEKYWDMYFATLRECLRAKGTAGLQIITIDDKLFPKYSRRPDFIQRYIFPGGMLPSPQILEKLRTRSGMTLLGEKVFAQDYAKTLAEWRRRFSTKWHEIRPLGFDERFKRMWEFYLHYCEAGFKSEQIDVRQIIYRK